MRNRTEEPSDGHSLQNLSRTHGAPADQILGGSGSSSAWCSAHNESAAAGRMLEDPEFLKFGSARDPWSLEKQSSWPV